MPPCSCPFQSQYKDYAFFSTSLRLTYPMALKGPFSAFDWQFSPLPVDPFKCQCLPNAFPSHVTFQTTLSCFSSLAICLTVIQCLITCFSHLLLRAETWELTYLCISSIWITGGPHKCLLSEPNMHTVHPFLFPPAQSLGLIWGYTLPPYCGGRSQVRDNHGLRGGSKESRRFDATQLERDSGKLLV